MAAYHCEARMSLHRRVRHRFTCCQDPCPHRLQEIAARAPRRSFYDRSAVRHDLGLVKAVTAPQTKKEKISAISHLSPITIIDFWEGMIHTASVKYDEGYLLDIACHLTSDSPPSEQYAIVAAASRSASDLAIMAGLLELQDIFPDLLVPEGREIYQSRDDPARAVKYFLRTCLELATYPGHIRILRDTLEDIERKEALQNPEFLGIFGVGGSAWEAN